MTRAFIELGHGRWAAAADLHPVAPFLYVTLVLIALLSAVQIAGGREILETNWKRNRRWIVLAVISSMAISWGVNLVRSSVGS